MIVPAFGVSFFGGAPFGFASATRTFTPAYPQPNRYPDILVLVDFLNAPPNSVRAWTDVTADVRDISYTRSGRNDELQRTEAGTLDALLDNRLAKYDPLNTVSPLYPGVKRMRWIWVLARWAGVVYPRWMGLIESWKQTWPAFGKDATVEIAATDVFKVLNLFDLEGLTYDEALTDQRVSDVCADVGLLCSRPEAGVITIPAVPTLAEGSTALPHLQAVEETENGLAYADWEGQVAFQNLYYRATHSASSAATIGDSFGEIAYRTGELDLSDDDIWNQVAVTPDGGTAVVVEDADSIAHHYKRRLNRSLLSSSSTVAADTAAALLARYADPPPRIPEVELLPEADVLKWPSVLSAVNSDRYTWKRRAAATITHDVYLERVKERISPASGWQVVWQMSPAAAAGAAPNPNVMITGVRALALATARPSNDFLDIVFEMDDVVSWVGS